MYAPSMKHIQMLLIFVALLSGCTVERRSVDLSSAKLDEAREIARQAVANEGIVGLSIAVAIGDKIALVEGYGHLDLEKTRSATADTIYDIASIGKQFTAAAVLQLVDDGKLYLNDQIGNVVPATPEYFPNATIYELLHHTSGFVSGKLDELNPPPGLEKPRSGLEVLDDVGLQQGHIEFGRSETFQYSNSGYLLLGLAVESVSVRPYPEFVRDRLFTPAGMRNATVYDRSEEADMADSLHRSDEGVRRVPLIHMSVYAGQGSICSSVIDLIRWNNALERGEILAASSMREYRSTGRVRGYAGNADMPYGAGQRLGSFHGHRKVGHTGTYDGGSAVLATYPDADLTIAVLTNTNGRGVPHARTIESRVAALLLGVEDPVEPPTARPVPADVRSRIEGIYNGGNNHYEARFIDDALHVLLGDKTVGSLVWVGGMEFRDPDNPSVRDWFIMDGEVAGWWVYEVDGMCMNVSRRKCAGDAPDSGAE